MDTRRQNCLGGHFPLNQIKYEEKQGMGYDHHKNSVNFRIPENFVLCQQLSRKMALMRRIVNWFKQLII